MSYANAISSPLKRKIKSGKNYGALIPKAENTIFNFGNEQNNTFDGVSFLNDWAAKHTWQFRDLVLRLIKDGTITTQNLQRLCSEVYRFLYDHFQYTADEQLQRLHSPASAWHNRQNGIDCKTYTILTVAILNNLGIKSFIRQVKQSTYSDLWTHVYVVVPKNQKNPRRKDLDNKENYYVIDATKHQNTEVFFTEKSDVMAKQAHKYIGMNAPQSGVLTATEYQGTLDFAQELMNDGMSKSTVKNMFEYINTLIAQGFSKNQIIVAPAKTGVYVAPTRNHKGRIFLYENNQALNGFLDNLFGGGNKGGDDDSTINLDNDNLDNVLDEAFNEATSSGWWNSTFGAVFSNGFKVSCFGSNTNPEKQLAFADVDRQGLITQSGLASMPSRTFDVDRFNRFVEMTGGYIARLLEMKHHVDARCSKEGYQAAADMMNRFLTEIVNAVKSGLSANGYSLVVKSTGDRHSFRSYNLPLVQGSWTGGANAGIIKSDYIDNVPFAYNIYKLVEVNSGNDAPTKVGISEDISSIISNASSVGGSSGSVKNIGSSSGVTNYNPNDSATKNVGQSKPKVQTASLGIAALAIAVLAYPSLKKSFAGKMTNLSTKSKK